MPDGRTPPMRYFKVTGLEKHQHYKDRRPPWIKLHAAVLDDYEFGRLQDASKAHAMLIWVLASQNDNRLPMDPEWVGQKISARSPVDLDGLVSAGFLTLYESASESIAERVQNGAPETEAEGETEAEPPRQQRARATTPTRTAPRPTVPFDGAGFTRWPELETLLGDAHCVANVVAFLEQRPPGERSAWIARFSAWLQGLDCPPSQRPTPAVLAAALGEYTGDGTPRHVWSFVAGCVIRWRQALENERQYSRAGSGQRVTPNKARASALWLVIRDNGLASSPPEIAQQRLGALSLPSGVDRDLVTHVLRALRPKLADARADHWAEQAILEFLAILPPPDADAA